MNTQNTDLPDLIAGALGVSRGTAYDMMREALAEQPEPDVQGEPVAWANFAENGNIRIWSNKPDGAEWSGLALLPLYTTPQPAVPERKPLTDGQIRKLWSDAHNDTTDRMAFQVFASLVESAHGIKGEA